MNEDFLRKLEKVAEERMVEATHKNFMGINGKIALIARILGQPILSQGYGDYHHQEGFFTDPLIDIPVLDDYYLDEQGWLWDGLSRGIHMEIRVESHKREIQATYKGYPVYKEVAGELALYTPVHPMAGDWEHHIDKLYKEVKKRKKIEAIEEQEIKKQMSPGIAQKLLDAIKMRWGQ